MITITNSTYRLIAAIGFGLVWAGGAAAAEKVKAPTVSVCQNEIYRTDLRWSLYDSDQGLPPPYSIFEAALAF